MSTKIEHKYIIIDDEGDMVTLIYTQNIGTSLNSSNADELRIYFDDKPYPYVSKIKGTSTKRLILGLLDGDFHVEHHKGNAIDQRIKQLTKMFSNKINVKQSPAHRITDILIVAGVFTIGWLIFKLMTYTFDKVLTII